MYRKFLCLTFTLLLCLFSGCGEDSKGGIAVVDSDKAIAESDAGRAAMTHLEKMSFSIQEEIVALQEAIEKAKDEDKEAAQAALQRHLREAQQEFAAEQQKVFALVDEHVKKTLTDLRAVKNIGVILFTEATIIFDETLDITQEVIDSMNRTPLPFFAQEPAVKDSALSPETIPSSGNALGVASEPLNP